MHMYKIGIFKLHDDCYKQLKYFFLKILNNNPYYLVVKNKYIHFGKFKCLSFHFDKIKIKDMVYSTRLIHNDKKQ